MGTDSVANSRQDGGRERTISEKYLKTLAICLKSQGVDVSKDSYRDGA